MEAPASPIPVPATPRRRWKWLRITVSAVFVGLAVKFVALWVRSYSNPDLFSLMQTHGGDKTLLVESDQGFLVPAYIDITDTYNTVPYPYWVDGVFYCPPGVDCGEPPEK